MRTVNSATSTAEDGASLAPRYSVVVQKEILKFDSGTGSSVGTSSQIIPQNYLKSLASSEAGLATYKSSNGNLYMKAINVGTAANYFLSHAIDSIVTNGQWNQRAGIVNISGSQQQVFSGRYTGSVVQMQYYDTVAGTYTDFGATIPRTLVNNASQVRRIEAVCAMRSSLTECIVAIGTFNFLESRATIEFWYVNSSLTYQLDAFIEADFTDLYTSWWSENTWASYICAGYVTDGIGVYANALPTGRGVMFTIKHGVESPVMPIFPIDNEQIDTSFVPYDMTKINNVYYLTGRYSKTNTDQTVVGFDMYLTSSDGWNWSIGERSCYITNGKYNGKMMLLNDTTKIVYGGNNRLFIADTTPLQSSASTLTKDLTSALQSWSLTQTTNASDGANFIFAKDASWGTTLTFLSENGLIAYLKSYQLGDSSIPNFAVLGLDSIQREMSLTGERDYPMVGRDIAGKRLGDWKTSFDIWMNSLSDIETTFESDDTIQSKTPIHDIKTNEKKIKEKKEAEVEFLKGIGLRYRGLNSPYVGFFDKPNLDGMMEMRIHFNVIDAFDKSAAYAGFVFGASEDKDENVEGNMVLFPKKGTWAGSATRPFLAKFNLVAIDPDDPTKVGTGLKNLEFRASPILTASGDAARAIVSSLDSNITYRMRRAYNGSIPTDTQAEINGDSNLLIRTFGRKVQYFFKHNPVYGDTPSDYAFYEFLGEGLFDDRAQMRPSKKNSGGIILGTESYSSKDNFEQGQYGDVTSTLTQVSDFIWNDDYATAMTKKIGYGKMEIDGPAGPIRIEHFILSNPFGVSPFVLPTGYFFKVLPHSSNPSGPAGLFHTTSDLGIVSTWPAYPYGGSAPTATQNDAEVSFSNGFKPSSGTWNVEIYVQNDAVIGDHFGWASSKTHYELVRPVEGEEYFDITDPKAKKRNNLIYGRGIFITEDNSAVSERYIRSDGIMHEVLSCGYSGTVWDLNTNPLEHGGDNDQHFNSTSNSKEWRLMLYHGKFFDGDPATYNLPSVPFYMIVDDELIRAWKEEYMTSSYNETSAALAKGLYVPVFYRPLAEVARNSATLTGWASGPNTPGDDFAGSAGAIKEKMVAAGSSIAGLLVEINTRNIDDQVEVLQYYAVDASYDTIDHIALDKAYKGRLTTLEAVAVVSGRGQFGTIKEKHDPDSIVCYAPIDAYGTFPSIIVPKFNYYNGQFMSTEDAIKKTCTLAGQRDVSFRTLFTSGADWSGTITNGVTTLPLINTLKNFDMKANLYIPGNSLASSPNYKLNITFRNNYRLIVQQWNDNATITDGHHCNILVGLVADDAAVTACAVGSLSRKYGNEKWLRGIVIPVKKPALSGTISGSSGSWSYSNDQTGRFNLRVVVNENNVYVELEGQQLYTFNLDDYETKYDSAGPITIFYDQGTLSATATIHIGELGDPFTGYAIKQNNTARSSIDEIIKDRGIYSRSTQNGGIQFSQFMTRDDDGNLTANLIKDSWSTADNILIGHVLMAGGVNANYFDAALLQTEGYKFDSMNNSLVNNTESALREAKLAVRRAKELSLQRSVAGYAKSIIQPEDKVTLVYTGLSSVDYIISSVTFNASKSALKSDYTLRKFIE